ncbi:MAG: TonB-dependent receptor [Melioribacteraceae bacterium]|nr:TonB-dependent receptor [Melioribacteraceae bacterium]MCF8264467.1 TonB-dependent receptor [Melioribacteraceae bacterium]
MKFIYFVSIILIICTTNLSAGTTGKIAGVITDKATGEPLFGANVLVVGTNYGGAANIDGEYFIINVPPGVYEIRASVIGFTSIVVKNVRVSVDQTTKIDFELSEEAVQMSDVVVTASKPIVQKDLTSTESKVSGEQISMLPLEDVASVVNLQAGVVDGHFRGGRGNEVKYLIDGVPVNDAFTGQSSLNAEVNSIEEVQVLTGTFNAEYGEALSGVVNQVTKIAGDELDGEFSFYSGDYVSGRDGLFTNIDNITPTGSYNFQGSLSGPVPGLKNLLKFFISGRYNYNDGYLYGRRMFNPSDSSNFSANDREDWHVGNTGDNEYVPMNYGKRLSLNGKLALNVGSGKGIVFTGIYQDNEYKSYNHQYKLNPDGDYTRFEKSYLGIVSYTLVLSNSAFIDFSTSGLLSEYNQYVFENPLDSRYVNPDRRNDVSGSSFYTGGTENWHFNHQTTSITNKADLTWQFNQTNQLKMGLEYQYHNLDYEDFQIVIDATSGFEPVLPEKGAFNYNTYSANPFQFAAYVQDKIELDYLIINAGLRFDYFQPDGKFLKDPNRINVLDELQPPFPDSLLSSATAKFQFSPRIGISYPITDRGAIHISYGHFFQIPPFENLYRNPNFRIPLTGNFPANIGNTIGNSDLEPQQTVMYEIGLQQALTEEIGVTVTGYYKDIRNLLSTEIYIKNEFRKFSKLVNKDYGAVKGLTLSLQKRFLNGFGATVDYTYQVAKGNASDPNDAFNKAQSNPPIEINKQLVPLNWDRTHSFNFTLTAGQPGDYIASLVGRLGSGFPYTPSLQNQRTGLENSDNKPSIFNVDLYATKYFKIGVYQISVFAKVYNLFDTANEYDVFGDTGRAGYSLELTRDQEQPRGVNSLKEFYSRPDFYSAPRQIILGASIAFQ